MRPTEGFCDLPSLLFEIHESSPQQECVFRQVDEHGIRNCDIEIPEEDCVTARSHFNSILFISGVFSGVRQNKSKVMQVFSDLAGLLLCEEHACYRRSLRLQWEQEFGERRTEILSELEDYYGKPGSSYEAENEKGFTRLFRNIDEKGVARKVTKVLEKQAGVRDRDTGCVYIISPEGKDFQGMLKIGFSKKHPQGSRFRSYKGCFGNFDPIKIRAVTYARRVEQLLLSEFSCVRYKRHCRKCDKAHIEWLKIDAKAIVNSLDKWCDFFDNTNTYKANGQFMTLPQEGLELPSPVLPEYLRQQRSANSTPSKGTPRGKTPSKKSASKNSSGKKAFSRGPPKKDTPTPGAPTETIIETPRKIRPQSSLPTSPLYPHSKSPTVTTIVVPSSGTPDSVPEGNDSDGEDSDVGFLAAVIRRLKFI
ncbi:hypothetical protein PMG11_03268 [Penicillium brasilianum]|uniref:Bacteriophage T5 Orf172 DNA-binding domain-containing protein n=1 Tax=Penicillium brasilianum TaxID=104259 RepID=A0A0F7V9P7_PENBI|nr:hypothetical protein PMG11_03268 [Penicillium brasilianum]